MTVPTTYEAPSKGRLNGVLFLLSLSVLINYIDRSNLSIAAPLIKDELHISASQLGTLLSAFFWIYAFMQIPAGWLVDRFDVKWVFAAGFFLWSAATAVTGVLHGFAALLIIRVILGIGESVAFPSYSKILATYFDKSRRGSANSLIIAGLALGPGARHARGRNCRRTLRLAAHSFSRSDWSPCCGWCRGGCGCRAASVRSPCLPPDGRDIFTCWRSARPGEPVWGRRRSTTTCIFW